MSDSPELVEQLLATVVAYTWFFDTCDESVVDDDTAVKQLEQAAYFLNRLADADKLRLVEKLATMATRETDPEYRGFIKRFAYTTGLVEIEEER